MSPYELGFNQEDNYLSLKGDGIFYKIYANNITPNNQHSNQISNMQQNNTDSIYSKI